MSLVPVFYYLSLRVAMPLILSRSALILNAFFARFVYLFVDDSLSAVLLIYAAALYIMMADLCVDSVTLYGQWLLVQPTRNMSERGLDV